MKDGRTSTDFQQLIDKLMLQLEGKDHMIQHLLDKNDSLETRVKIEGKICLPDTCIHVFCEHLPFYFVFVLHNLYYVNLTI